MMDFQRLYLEVRDKAFPEIHSKFIPNLKVHFMKSSDITGNIYYNYNNILAMKFLENAVKGVIAHELAHQVDFKRRGRSFLKKILEDYRCSRDEVYRRGFEREADRITVERGYGKELLEAMKQTKKMFPKDRWKRYEAAHLSMKEVNNLIGELGLIKRERRKKALKGLKKSNKL